MEIIKEADFRKEIKSKPRTSYLFFGDEDYMKSFAMKLATEAISPDPSFSFFNEVKLDALSYSPSALLDALMPLPMLAERKLVTVTGLDLEAMKAGEIDELCSVLSQLEEYDYNTVILNVAADKLDGGSIPKKPSAILKKLGEYTTPVYFEKNTPARLAAWVAKHFEHNGVSASPDVCAFVIERCGRDMFNLASETDKLSYYAKANGKNEITKEDVILAATPAAEYDAFAFTNAIGARKKEEALEILRELKLRKTDPISIMGEITRTVCDMVAITTLKADGLTVREIADALKIHEYRVSIVLNNNLKPEVCRVMLARCRDADLELKSWGDGYAALERLICTI